MKVSIFLLLLAIVGYGNCKIFGRCELADILDKYRISRTFLANWICLIEGVSKRDTALQVIDPNGTFKYGLYQLPNKWCGAGKKGGICNIACESLLDDDITDDTACAQKIFLTEGLAYWPLWEEECKHKRDINELTKELSKCKGMLPRGGLEFLNYSFVCTNNELSESAHCYVMES